MQARTVPPSLAREARAELDRIIAWWAAKTPDPRGGFFGEIDAQGQARSEANKAVVLNTRLLWFFSAAYAHTRSPLCRDLAQRAADYVATHFIDAEYGGLFWLLDAKGKPIDRRKQAYAQAFGVYAYSAHFTATGETASLDRALKLSDLLESHFRDRDNGGYWEALGEALSPIADMRLSERDLNAPKSMNAHLHVLEAYTALYRAHPVTPVAALLENALRIMLERVLDREAGHLRLFFDRDWGGLDQTVSFGHDIEASWLMCEAAHALGDGTLYLRAREAALALARSTLVEAFGPYGEVFEERAVDGHVSHKRVWWIQAEGLVGWLNAYALTKDVRYLDASEQVWRFIREHQIDPNGEWRAASALDAQTNEPQAGHWKCPYHTGRAMMEVERRATALAAATQELERQH